MVQLFLIAPTRVAPHEASPGWSRPVARCLWQQKARPGLASGNGLVSTPTQERVSAMRYLIFAVFTMAGIALGALNVWNNAMAINDGQLVFNDLTGIVAGLAVTGALLSLALGSIAKRSWIVGLMAAVVIVGCTVVSVGYTLKRVGGVSDAGAGDALAHNGRIKRTKGRLADLRSKLEKQREVAARECRGYKPGKSNPAKWPLCLTAQGLVGSYEADIAAANATLNRLGAPRVADSAGQRIEALLGGVGITAERYRTAHPVITAGTLELGVNLLLTVAGLFAASGGQRRRSEAPGKPNDGEMIDITPADPVERLLRQQRRALTNTEIAKALGISPPAASQRVRRLIDAGAVRSERVGRKVAISLA